MNEFLGSKKIKTRGNAAKNVITLTKDSPSTDLPCIWSIIYCNIMNIATIPPKNTPLDHWSIYNPKAIPANIEMTPGSFNLFQFLFWTSASEISFPFTDLIAIMKNMRNKVLKNTSPTWWSVNPITERDSNWPGIIATRKADNRPTRLSKVHLPMKYTGNTTNAPNIPGKYAPIVLVSSRLGEPAPNINDVMAIMYVHRGPKWKT